MIICKKKNIKLIGSCTIGHTNGELSKPSSLYMQTSWEILNIISIINLTLYIKKTKVSNPYKRSRKCELLYLKVWDILRFSCQQDFFILWFLQLSCPFLNWRYIFRKYSLWNFNLKMTHWRKIRILNLKQDCFLFYY